MIYLLYILICFLATTLGAVSGLGGGVLIKPALDAFSSYSVSSVSFLSSAAVFSMSLFSIAQSLLQRKKAEDPHVPGAREALPVLQKRRGTLLGAGASLGGILGKLLFQSLQSLFPSENLLGAIQSALLFSLIALVLLYMRRREKLRAHEVKQALPTLLIGFFLGLFSAFLGVGGGPFNLAVLYFFFSMDTKTAALHSLYIILLSQAGAILLTLLRSGLPPVPPLLLLALCLAGIAGGILGRCFNKKLSSRPIERIFEGTLLLILGICLFNLFTFLS